MKGKSKASCSGSVKLNNWALLSNSFHTPDDIFLSPSNYIPSSFTGMNFSINDILQNWGINIPNLDNNASYHIDFLGNGNYAVANLSNSDFNVYEGQMSVEIGSFYHDAQGNPITIDNVSGSFGIIYLDIPNRSGGGWDVANQGGGWDNSKLALDIGGGLYGALQTTVRPGNQWLGVNGKYYNNSWGGNQYTGSRSGAFKVANQYKAAGYAVLGVSAVIGGIETYQGYQMDGGQFGYNAQSATAQTIGSIGGGLAGAEVGMYVGGVVGTFFGGFGAIPGAAIGGFVGGFIGGNLGGNMGQGSVNWYHGR